MTDSSFDVFISYRKTDNYNQPTTDSYIFSALSQAQISKMTRSKSA